MVVYVISHSEKPKEVDITMKWTNEVLQEAQNLRMKYDGQEVINRLVSSYGDQYDVSVGTLQVALYRAKHRRPQKVRDYSYLKETEKAYIAGVIDGEGHIDKFGIVITNTNYEFIRWLKNKVGGHIRVKKPRTANHKTGYDLAFTAAKARGLLQEVKTYLKIKLIGSNQRENK